MHANFPFCLLVQTFLHFTDFVTLPTKMKVTLVCLALAVLAVVVQSRPADSSLGEHYNKSSFEILRFRQRTDDSAFHDELKRNMLCFTYREKSV